MITSHQPGTDLPAVDESRPPPHGRPRRSAGHPAREPAGRPVPGDGSDFETFYVNHVNGLIVQLHAYTGDQAQAQDVVQEAFARALPRWERLCRYDDPVAWVRRVAWNLATTRWRQVRWLHVFAQTQREEHVPAPSPDRVAVITALGRLPAQQRRAVVLYYLADLPVAQIARQEATAEGTVKSWLHRGRAALAAALSETAEGVPATEPGHGREEAADA